MAPHANELFENTGRAVQRLASCGWKFAIQASLLYIPHSQHPPDNVKLLQRQLSNDETAVPVQNHRGKAEEEEDEEEEGEREGEEERI